MGEIFSKKQSIEKKITELGRAIVLVELNLRLEELSLVEMRMSAFDAGEEIRGLTQTA